MEPFVHKPINPKPLTLIIRVSQDAHVMRNAECRAQNLYNHAHSVNHNLINHHPNSYPQPRDQQSHGQRQGHVVQAPWDK